MEQAPVAESGPNRRVNGFPWLLALFVLYQAVQWLAWVIPSRHYVGFDEGWHLEVSQYLYHGLTDHGLAGLGYRFIHAMQAKPPLISLLPVPMYLLFGNHVISAAGVNLVWLVLLNVFLYRLVRHFWGDGPALLSCIFLQAMPLFQGLSRIVMAEYGTAVLVIMFMYFLFTRPPSPKRAIVLGIIMGFGLLEKVLFPTYVAGPLLWMGWTELRSKTKESRQNPLFLWLISFGIALILAGPWYVMNFRHLMGYTFQSTYGELAKVYRFGTTLRDASALWAYLLSFLNGGGITAYAGILLVMAWLGCLVFGRKRFQKADSSILIGIALWFILPFLMYLPSLYRNFKFMMPFFAPAAIALGVLLWRLFSLFRERRWRWVLIILLLLWPNFAVVYTSFPLGRLNQPYRYVHVGPFQFLPLEGYIGFPKKGRWPYLEVLEYVSSDGACIKASRGRLPTLGMAVDTSDFNRNAMIYEQRKGRYPVSVHWAPLGGSSDPAFDLAAALVLTSQHDYVLFRVPNLMDPEFTNRFNDQIRQQIETGRLPFQLTREFSLPDGGKALIYRRLLY